MKPGNIIIRQRGTKYRVGENVGLGRDHTLWALVEGHVKFSYDKFRQQNTVSVVPSLKHGDVCTHKALEARAHNHLDRAMGFLGQVLSTMPTRRPMPRGLLTCYTIMHAHALTHAHAAHTQAKFAYSMAGDEGVSRNEALKAAIDKVPSPQPRPHPHPS